MPAHSVSFKGLDKPLEVYNLQGLREHPAPRHNQSQIGISSPLVGRDSELGAFVERIKCAQGGQGGAFR